MNEPGEIKVPDSVKVKLLNGLLQRQALAQEGEGYGELVLHCPLGSSLVTGGLVVAQD